MTITRTDAIDTVKRLTSVYSRLRRDDTMRDEIGQALMRHADKLTVPDLYAGCTALIETLPARQKDGGPAAPPGPHEVLGCVLQARHDRVREEPKVRFSMAQSVRDKVRAGERITRAEALAHDVYEPGLSYREWWSGLTADEKIEHRILNETVIAGGVAIANSNLLKPMPNA